MKYVCHVLLCVDMCTLYLKLANCFSKENIIFYWFENFSKKVGIEKEKKTLMAFFDKIINDKFWHTFNYFQESDIFSIIMRGNILSKAYWQRFKLF
jgi:hypothetical protein